MDRASTRPRGRQKRNAAVQQAANRDKCTLLLDADTSLKLTVAAHLRGLDRSELVNQILADALRYVVIALRGQSTVSANAAGQVSPSEAEAA